MRAVTSLLVAAAFAVSAAAADFAAVFTRRDAIPVAAETLWSDKDIRLFGGYPTADALLGYDGENVRVGYSVSLNWTVSGSTTVGVGLVYLGEARRLNWRDAGDSLGVAVLFRVR